LRCASAPRRRAPSRGQTPPRPRSATRTRPAGVRPQRRARRLRGHVHLAALGGGGPRGRYARGGSRGGSRARARRVSRRRERTRGDALGAGVPRDRTRAAGVTVGRVTWSPAELPAVLAALRLQRPLLVASERWPNLAAP